MDNLLAARSQIGMSLALHLTAIASLVAFQGLFVRNYRRARVAAVAQIGLIVFGWGVAQFPYLVRPNLTIVTAAAPTNILVDIEIACAIGAIVLFPSLYLLFFRLQNSSEGG